MFRMGSGKPRDQTASFLPARLTEVSELVQEVRERVRPLDGDGGAELGEGGAVSRQGLPVGLQQLPKSLPPDVLLQVEVKLDLKKQRYPLDATALTTELSGLAETKMTGIGAAIWASFLVELTPYTTRRQQALR